MINFKNKKVLITGATWNITDYKITINGKKKESKRFLKEVQKLKKIKPGHLYKLNVVINKSKLKRSNKKGIF